MIKQKMEKLRIFNHIPKCGGSTIRELLKLEYGDRLLVLDNNTTLPIIVDIKKIECIIIELNPFLWPNIRNQIVLL